MWVRGEGRGRLQPSGWLQEMLSTACPKKPGLLSASLSSLRSVGGLTEISPAIMIEKDIEVNTHTQMQIRHTPPGMVKMRGGDTREAPNLLTRTNERETERQAKSSRERGSSGEG